MVSVNVNVRLMLYIANFIRWKRNNSPPLTQTHGTTSQSNWNSLDTGKGLLLVSRSTLWSNAVSYETKQRFVCQTSDPQPVLNRKEWDGRACRRRPDTWSTTAAGKPLDPTAGCVLPDPCVLSQTHGVGPWDHRTVAGDSVWEWSVLPATQLDLPLPLWSNTHSAGWNRNYPRGVCRGLENRGIHSPCEMSLLQKCPCLH